MGFPYQLDARPLVVFAGFMGNGVSMRVARVDVGIGSQEERQRSCGAMFRSVVNGKFRLVICRGKIEVLLVNEILENVGVVVHRTEMSRCLTEVVLSVDVATYGRPMQSGRVIAVHVARTFVAQHSKAFE